MWQRQPDRSELPQARRHIVEETSRLIDVSDGVDMNECEIAGQEEQERIDNNERGDNRNKQTIAL